MKLIFLYLFSIISLVISIRFYSNDVLSNQNSASKIDSVDESLGKYYEGSFEDHVAELRANSNPPTLAEGEKFDDFYLDMPY